MMKSTAQARPENGQVEEGDGGVRAAVRRRYAKAAKGTESEGSCCGPTCCGGGKSSARGVSESVGYGASELDEIPEGADLGLGCGNPTAIAALRPGEVVLDLGSGAGIDAFLAAGRVGPSGKVFGVDMTPEMVDRARGNAGTGGYANVEFRLGEIEALPLPSESVDVVLSNCVLNLSPDKDRALAEAFRVLKPGGRMVISDMVSDKPVPEALQGDLEAVAGCLPTHEERYLDEIRSAGFANVRITSRSAYPSSHILDDAAVKAVLASRPALTSEVTAFAGAIFGAHFEADKL